MYGDHFDYDESEGVIEAETLDTFREIATGLPARPGTIR